MTACARGEYDAALRHADILGPHDLVGLALFEEAIHMDSGAVRERIGADHRFVGRNLEPSMSATRRLVRNSSRVSTPVWTSK